MVHEGLFLNRKELQCSYYVATCRPEDSRASAISLRCPGVRNTDRGVGRRKLDSPPFLFRPVGSLHAGTTLEGRPGVPRVSARLSRHTQTHTGKRPTPYVSLTPHPIPRPNKRRDHTRYFQVEKCRRASCASSHRPGIKQWPDVRPRWLVCRVGGPRPMGPRAGFVPCASLSLPVKHRGMRDGGYMTERWKESGYLGRRDEHGCCEVQTWAGSPRGHLYE